LKALRFCVEFTAGTCREAVHQFLGGKSIKLI
jgi:hypothetical protein